MKLLILLSVLWFSGSSPVTISVSSKADPVVSVATEMLSGDLLEVTGQEVKAASPSKAAVRIVQYDKDRVNLQKLGVPEEIADSLSFVKEAFYVGEHGGKILVVGSDGRGTAYGALEVSRLAGVSPWIWWGDSRPEKKSRLEIPEGYSTFQHPSIEYRGIFLNDEDWGFRPWSAQTFSPQEDGMTISADTYREIFKLMLRLRANTVWPGMHNGTKAFFLVDGAKEAADSCGIFIGTSHCEPLLRNNVGEWDVNVRGPYNYITNRKAVQDYWIERLKEMKGHPGLYTIGMRGIHDGSMEGVNTLEEKTVALQQVIDDQRGLLKKYTNPDVTKIPQMFMPYKEVLEIMENGLKVPDDVTIVWCDDNYGYMTRLSDSEQQKRSGGAGVYYHISYCGRPHDYLWLTTTQSGLIYHEMMEAYNHNARKLWVVNVNDPKKAAYDLEFFLDMAWNVDFVQPETVTSHLYNWLSREYGEKAADILFGPMQEFYRLCAIRKPEFMGWSQCEVANTELYGSLGLSPVKDTEFSFTEFGNEAQRYIDSYRAVAKAADEAAQLIPERMRDSYFGYILYPVKAAGAMAEKMLYAQRSRQWADATYSPFVWNGTEDMLAATALSERAYGQIKELTGQYNKVMGGGKWNRIMSWMPRRLYVFWAPDLPVALNDAEIKEWAPLGEAWKADKLQSSDSDYYASNACDFSSASASVHPVRNLGHSSNAVPVPKGESLSYDFQVDSSGDAVVRVAVIPTQANDRGDIRFSVSIDGAEPTVFSIKEPYRSERWKENVMRGQAVVTMPVKLEKGQHSIRLSAVDDHIIFDQWMVDFKPDRKFYVFPLEAAN